jgi:hypothetical protein
LVDATRSPDSTVRGGVSFTATLVFATSKSHNVSFSIEVIRPQQPWDGRESSGPENAADADEDANALSTKHPVFLTQSNHRRWALTGVSRGYTLLHLR